MIHFRIDESVAHSWTPIFGNHKNSITKQHFDNVTHSSTLLCTTKMTLHQRLRWMKKMNSVKQTPPRAPFQIKGQDKFWEF